MSSTLHCTSLDVNIHSAVPTKADIQLMLTTEERQSGLQSGSIAWLAMGINLENAQ